MLLHLVALLIEPLLVAGALLVSFASPRALPRWTAPLRRRLARLARRRAASIVTVGLVAGSISAAVSWVHPPVPAIHDEFCYLLQADTFAHGRLANPTHPMWRHFETFHVIHEPSYVAKYPPAQGLALAAARLVTGSPVPALWVTTGLAAAALCWMLQGWVPPRWALLGGLLVAAHINVQRFWGNSFWGGNLAFLGGALLYGALPRILRRPRPGPAVLLGLGLVILANSRPYEGLVASVPAAVALLGWLAGRRRPAVGTALCRVVVPASLVMAAGAAWTAYYDYRTTGDPWRMPYSVHEETYAVAPNFLWQPLRDKPQYRHAALQTYHAGWEVQRFLSQRTLAGFLRTKLVDTFNLWTVFVRFALLAPLVALPWALGRRRVRFVAAALGLALAASYLTKWSQPHYFAPAVPLFFLLAVEGFRQIRTCTFRGEPLGRSLVAGTLAAYFAGGILLLAASSLTPDPVQWKYARQHVLAQLDGLPGNHLVIVASRPRQNPHEDWVYNGADLDGAKVLFARGMAPAQDRELLEYYKDRRVWLLEADASPPRLVPYPASAGAARTAGRGQAPSGAPAGPPEARP